MRGKGFSVRIDKYFFRINDPHFCYVCSTKLIKVMKKELFNEVEANSFFKFHGVPTKGEADVYHNTYYCPSCQRHIEYVTQLSIEDIDLAIKYVKEQFAMQGKQIRIDRFFEIKDGSLQKAVEDIKNIKGVKFEVYQGDNLVCELLYPKFVYMYDTTKNEKEQYFLISPKKLFKEIKRRL